MSVLQGTWEQSGQSQPHGVQHCELLKSGSAWHTEAPLHGVDLEMKESGTVAPVVLPQGPRLREGFSLTWRTQHSGIQMPVMVSEIRTPPQSLTRCHRPPTPYTCHTQRHTEQAG